MNAVLRCTNGDTVHAIGLHASEHQVLAWCREATSETLLPLGYLIDTWTKTRHPLVSTALQSFVARAHCLLSWWDVHGPLHALVVHWLETGLLTGPVPMKNGPHVCKWCGWGFPVPSDLGTHLGVHATCKTTLQMSRRAPAPTRGWVLTEQGREITTTWAGQGARVQAASGCTRQQPVPVWTAAKVSEGVGRVCGICGDKVQTPFFDDATGAWYTVGMVDTADGATHPECVQSPRLW
jgi:hypothetical protein